MNFHKDRVTEFHNRRCVVYCYTRKSNPYLKEILTLIFTNIFLSIVGGVVTGNSSKSILLCRENGVCDTQ